MRTDEFIENLEDGSLERLKPGKMEGGYTIKFIVPSGIKDLTECPVFRNDGKLEEYLTKNTWKSYDVYGIKGGKIEKI